jgi:hypothetical protein
MKTRIFTIVTLLVGIAIACAVSEVLVRVMLPQRRYPHPQGLYVPDEATGYRNTPGFSARWQTDVSDVPVHVNSLGFRGAEPATDDSAGRILILGDSFTFGPEVADDETFAARLEARLHQGDTRHWQVYNGGVNGFGAVQQAALLHIVGTQVRPDILVVAFYNNDIKDSIREPRTVSRGLLVNTGGAVDPENLGWYSHAWSLLERRVQGIIDKNIKPASVLAVYRREYSDKMQQAWELTADAYREIFAWCRTHDVQPVVMIINNGRQLEPDRFHDFRIDDADYDFMKPNTLVADLCGGLIPNPAILDLLPAFRAAGSPEDLYYHGAGHFTPFGHDVAAEVLAEFLATRQIVF